MSAAPELDPYLLPLPTPDSPVVLPHLVGELNARFNARFADPVWPLSPLSQNPSAKKQTIRWNRCTSETLREEMKLLAWIMINGQLRPSFLADRATSLRARISVEGMKSSVDCWFALAEWLAEQGICTLADCGTPVLHAYGRQMPLKDWSLNHGWKTLTALTRLWAFDQLASAPLGIGQPPWDIEGLDEYLPATPTTIGENATEPVAEQTMGPLLIWAMRTVDDFADDILAAWTERRQMIEYVPARPSTATGQAALHAYLDPLVAAHKPIPATKQQGKDAVARAYIASITGASGKQVDRYTSSRLREIIADRAGPCPLRTPITGRIGDNPWRNAIDFNETPDLVRHLGTAAFIVCAYLTGMRPGEVLGLRSGSCPNPIPDTDGRIGRHLIRSSVYKTALDEHGNHDSAGIERDVPWVAIAPVVSAIRVLEHMVPEGELLCDHHTHDVHARRPGTGSLKTQGLRLRIKDFVTWANNEAVAHNRLNEIIPDDPHGTISTSRFRRSLAWHIARRPNGLVALAIQYGHLRTAVSGNYASRARGGIHELIDIETARGR
jgi:hypothetical protein